MATTNKRNLNTVVGKVPDGNGHPVANLKVIIYDVDKKMVATCRLFARQQKTWND